MRGANMFQWVRTRIKTITHARNKNFSTLGVTSEFSTPTSPLEYDIVVVGGGIIGAASARELLFRFPTLKLALVEKEQAFAKHQTGNNSGVIHAGLYYKPGTLKAKLCVEGSQLAYKYCEENGIPYKKCGKLVVATEKKEIPTLLDLYDRGIQNGVKDLILVGDDCEKQIESIEPHCSGIQALFSPHTGIVSWKQVALSFIRDIKENGGKTYLGFKVDKFGESESNVEYPVSLISEDKRIIQARYVLTCCGLHSDAIAVMTGCSEDPKIVPFRGEYLILDSKKTHLVRGNIYPVPDPRFPFLGVHATPTIDGKVLLGPNALLAFKKEGYRWSDYSVRELWDIISYPGFRNLAKKYFGFGIKEMIRSAIIPLQVNHLNKYLDDLIETDVSRGPAGVRAQAMYKDGTLVDDFVFDSMPDSKSSVGARVLHCRNAPSPGATSSLAIAKMIADMMEKQFKLKF